MFCSRHFNLRVASASPFVDCACSPQFYLIRSGESGSVSHLVTRSISEMRLHYWVYGERQYEPLHHELQARYVRFLNAPKTTSGRAPDGGCAAQTRHSSGDWSTAGAPPPPEFQSQIGGGHQRATRSIGCILRKFPGHRIVLLEWHHLRHSRNRCERPLQACVDCCWSPPSRSDKMRFLQDAGHAWA